MLRNREAIIGRVRLQGDFFESLWRHYFAGAALVALILVTSLSTPVFAQSCTGNQAPVANAGPDQAGQVNVPLTFSSAGSMDPDGMLNSYWFNFGDGQFTGWQASPSVPHTFSVVGTYSVRLWVRDNCNAFSVSDTAVVTISNAPNPCNGNIAPIANAGADKSGTVGQSISFSGSGSVDLNGNNTISSYIWNFGDGTANGNGVNVSHSFAAVGNYNVTLTVTDNCNATHTDSAAVSITPVNPCINNLPPLADAGPNKTGTVGQAISLSGTASDVNNNLSNYSWNFGDGSALVSGQTASHIYASAGTYTATFSATDSCNAVGSDTATVTVNNPSGPCPTCPLQANFKVQKLVHVDLETGTETWRDIDLANDHLEIGLRHRLNASSSQGTITAYRWKKNGSTFSTQGPTILRDGPANAGDESIQLVLYGLNGTESSVTQVIPIAAGMQSLGTQAQAFIPILGSGMIRCQNGELVIPGAVAFKGSELWGFSPRQEAFTVADLSNPQNLLSTSQTRVFPTGALDSSQSLKASFVIHNGLLYLANGAQGVNIYRADRNNFENLGSISTTQMEGLPAHSVAKFGDALYVGSHLAAKIFIFSLENSTQINLVNVLQFPVGIRNIGGKDPGALGVFHYNTLQIVDVRDPWNPVLVGSPISVHAGGGNTKIKVDSNENFVISSTNVQVNIVRTQIGASGLMEATLVKTFFYTDFAVPSCCDRSFYEPSVCLSETNAYFFVYGNGPTGLVKVNLFLGTPTIAEIKQPTVSDPTDFGGQVFVHDYDGPLGPQDPVLFLALTNLKIGAFSD